MMQPSGPSVVSGFKPPPRTSTAPAATNVGFQRATVAPGARFGDSTTGGFESRVNDTPAAAGDGVTPFAPPPDMNEEGPEVSDDTSAPQSDGTSSTAAHAAADAASLPFRVYSVRAMQEVRRHISGRRTAEDYPAFYKFLTEQNLGEASVPEPALGRHEMFGGPVNPKRRVMDRKLPNQVLGILAKLTPENYDRLKKELLDLPIRQSTEEEVIEVVNTMYNKAVRPEDAPFVELYAKLMGDLVINCNVEGVGKTIRKAIIDKCQKQFEQPFKLDPKDEVDADGRPLPENEIEEKKSKLKDRLRTNIKFLSHLFICGMVREPVVNIVLYHLLYGKEANAQKKRKLDEFDLEMFCDLLQNVVGRLSDKVKEQYLPGYINTVREIVDGRQVVSKRTLVLLQNLLERHDNNWQGRRRGPAGPLRLDELERRDLQQKEQEQEAIARMIQDTHHKRPNAHGGGIVLPGAKRMGGDGASAAVAPTRFDLSDFNQVVNRVLDPNQQHHPSHRTAEVEQFMRRFPPETRFEGLTQWLYRLARVNKSVAERTVSGMILAGLVNSQLLDVEQTQQALAAAAKKLVQDADYEETPKLFINWCELVNSCCLSNVVHGDMHTVMLRQMTSGRAVRGRLTYVVGCMQACIDNPPRPPQRSEYPRRFRPLPVVLACSLDTSAAGGAANDEGANEDDDDEGDVDGGHAGADLLELLVEANGEDESTDISETAAVKDIELILFSKLCNPAVSSAQLSQYVKQALKESPPPTDREGGNRVDVAKAKLISAFFTYLRFDDVEGREVDRCKEALGHILSSKVRPDLVAIFSEAFATHRELGRLPRNGFKSFVMMVSKHFGATKEAVGPALRTVKDMVKAVATARGAKPVDQILLDIPEM